MSLPLSEPSQALVLAPGQDAPRLSEAQRQFGQWLERIEALTGQIQGLQAWSNRHLYRHAQALRELAQQRADLDKCMVLLLHDRLVSGVLKEAQQRSARSSVRSILSGLLAQKDPQVQALWHHYRLEEDDDDSAEELQAPSPEDLHLWRQQQAQVERRAAKRAARKAIKRPTSHLQAQELAADADSALRTIFRQLASALHPDREPDNAVRERKTALMSQVNAAYERKELATLLRIQLQVSQVDSSRVDSMADPRARALSLLLKEQATALEADLAQLELRLTCTMGVVVAASAGEQALTESIDRLQADQRMVVASLVEEYAQIQSDAGLKRWLKDQAWQMRQCARDALSD